MIILDSNYSLVGILSAAKTTTDMDFVVSFASSSTSAFTESIVTGTSNGLTEFEMVAAPAVSTSKVIKSIHVYNADTATKTLTIKVKTGATLRLIIKSDLAPGDTLIMSDRGEWSTFKNSYQEYGVLTLSADQTTNISDTNPIKFDTLAAGGNIQTDLVNYHVILRAGITYYMIASFSTIFSASGSLFVGFYDITNAGFVGVKSFCCPATYTGHYGPNPTISHIITPATAIDLSINILIAPSNFTTMRYLYTNWIIKSLY